MSEKQQDLKQGVEDHEGIVTIRGGGALKREWNNIGDEEVVAVVARSDAGEWTNIVNYDRETGKIVE